MKENKVYQADSRSQDKLIKAGEIDSRDYEFFIVSGQDEKKARYKVYKYLKQKGRKIQLTDLRLRRVPEYDYLRTRLKKCVIDGDLFADWSKQRTIPRRGDKNREYNLNQEARKAGLKVSKRIVNLPYDQQPDKLVNKLLKNNYSIQLTIK